MWAGFVGQLRLAGIAVLTRRRPVARRARGRASDRRSTREPTRQRAQRERPYLGTRATYTRRAFGVDAVRAPIRRSRIRRRLPRCRGCRSGIRRRWRARSTAGRAGRRADGHDRLARVRQDWSPTSSIRRRPEHRRVRRGRSRASSPPRADERGAPVRVAGAGASAIDDTPLEAPLVYPGAPPYTIIADSLTHSAGTSLEPFARAAGHRLVAAELSNSLDAICRSRIRRSSRTATSATASRCSRRSLRRDAQVDPLLARRFAVLGRRSVLDVVDVSAQPAYPFRRRRAHVLASCRRRDRSGVDRRHQRSFPTRCSIPIAATWVERLPSIFANVERAAAGTARAARAADRRHLRAGQRVRPLSASAATTIRRARCRRSTVPTRALVTDARLPIVLPGGKLDRGVALPLVDETDRAARTPDRHWRRDARALMWYPLAGASAALDRAVLDRLRSVDSAGSAAREGPSRTWTGSRVPIRAALDSCSRNTGGGRRPFRRLIASPLLAGDSARSIAPGTGSVGGPSDSRPRVARGDLRRRSSRALPGNARRAAARRLGGVRPRVRRAWARARHSRASHERPHGDAYARAIAGRR